MSCGCKSGQSIQSWNDFQNMAPMDPRDLISYVTLGLAQVVGAWYLSDTYIQPASGSVWIPSPITFPGEAIAVANATDEGQMNFDATSWNFQNKTVNNAATVAPPLRKVIFIRAGIQWMNIIPLGLGSSPSFVDLQLSFLENAATRGDMQGSVPVIRWAPGPYSGPSSMSLVVNSPGRFVLGLMGINNNSTPDCSMFEMDIIAV